MQADGEPDASGAGEPPKHSEAPPLDIGLQSTVAAEWLEVCMCHVDERWSRHLPATASGSPCGRRSANASKPVAILSLLVFFFSAGVASAQQPAVLVVTPQAGEAGWVDLDYLSQLHNAG